MRIICLFLLCLAVPMMNAKAQDPSPESVIAWFNDVCNRPAQVKAFWTIVKSGAGTAYNYYRLIEVRDEYDLPTVKEAFETFARSITIEWPDCPGGYVGSPSIARYEGPGESDDPIDPLVFSLCVWWEIEDDLYEMIDNMYFSGDIWYSMFVLDKVGTGYFEYGETQTASDPTYLRGLGNASAYLTSFENPSPEMVEAALDVIYTFADNGSELQRMRAVDVLTWVYQAGYEQVKSRILILKEDPSSEVRRIWRNVMSRAHRQNQMLEFEIDPEEPEE